MEKVQDISQKTEGDADSRLEPPAKTDKTDQTAKTATAKTEKTTVATKPGVGSSAAAKSKTIASEVPDDPVKRMRRTIIWTAVGGFLATCFVMFVRFFLPRALFEPSTKFKIGYTSDFSIGVDTKFQQQYRVWVVKNAERLFVIYAKCTHLGCTPDWKPSENKFKCPCHGSGYDSDGVNFEGPAPRPMDRALVELDPEGQVVVDTATLYSWERDKGKPTQFNKPGAYITV